MPLATLPGVLAEMSRTYKLMKRGKLDEETARARIWCLDKMRRGEQRSSASPHKLRS